MTIMIFLLSVLAVLGFCVAMVIDNTLLGLLIIVVTSIPLCMVLKKAEESD